MKLLDKIKSKVRRIRELGTDLKLADAQSRYMGAVLTLQRVEISCSNITNQSKLLQNNIRLGIKDGSVPIALKIYTFIKDNQKHSTLITPSAAKEWVRMVEKYEAGQNNEVIPILDFFPKFEAYVEEVKKDCIVRIEKMFKCDLPCGVQQP